MGLGPNKTSLARRVNGFLLGEMTPQELEAFVLGCAILRTTARTLGHLKRKQATPTVARPRKHKHHCLCLQPGTAVGVQPAEAVCCRCTMSKCLKPPPKKRVKKAPK